MNYQYLQHLKVVERVRCACTKQVHQWWATIEIKRTLPEWARQGCRLLGSTQFMGRLLAVSRTLRC